MKNNNIDKEKTLSNADNADMETSVENPMETPMETSVEHMLKSARDNPPKVPASLFDAVVADAIRLNPLTNKITNTPANLNTPPIYALAGLAACLCVGFIAGIGYLNSADGAEILTALWGDDSDITTLSALINIAD